MKKNIAASIASFSILMSGCALDPYGVTELVNDQQNNDFVSIEKESLDYPIKGLWTGSMGPYLVTIELKEDGSGEMCSSYAGTDNVSKLKYANKEINSQEGGRFKVSDYSNRGITLVSHYSEKISYNFISDKELEEATNYCKNHFNEG